MFEKLHMSKAHTLHVAALLLIVLLILSVYLFPPLKHPSEEIPSQSYTEKSTERLEAYIGNPITELETGEYKNTPIQRKKNDLELDITSGKESVFSLLSQLLDDYRSHDLSQEQKHAIRTILPEINASPEGRALIADFFFHPQNPEKSASMHDMILDVGLKDVTLINELIDRDKTEYQADFKIRLIDLIADHNTLQQPYSQDIEDFLADMSLHTDKRVSSAALSQWAWYVNQHKGLLPVLDA